MVQGFWHYAGGIVELCRLINEHGGALEYDLLCACGMTLADIPRRISWPALRSFVTHVGPTSALFRELNPEYAEWFAEGKTRAMLADIYDAIASLTFAFARANTPKNKRKPKPPKPYPRPWVKDKSNTKIGRDPIPIKDFDKWWGGDE